MRPGRGWDRIYDGVVSRVRAVLRQGLSPEAMALSICVGSAVGTLPLLGGTTLLCVGLTALLKLNHAAVQAVNYLVYPLQIALLVPFYRLGSRCFPWGPTLTDAVLDSAIHFRFQGAVTAIVCATLKALAAWLVTVPPLALLLYPLLVHLFRRRGTRSGDPAP